MTYRFIFMPYTLVTWPDKKLYFYTTNRMRIKRSITEHRAGWTRKNSVIFNKIRLSTETNRPYRCIYATVAT